MKQFKYIFQALLVSITAGLLLTSCIKDKFDEPPVNGPFPDIEATMTIQDFKALYSGSVVQIEEDIIIEGVVVGDDKSGNFYKTLVIQDETAGISIRIDKINLYTDFPVGRKVYIKCKGLYLGAYRNLIQLGGGVDLADPTDPSIQSIVSLLVDKYLVKGPTGQTVEPIDLDIADLSSSYQNMLIRLNNVQFATADAGQPYADAVAKLSVNRNLQDCNGLSTVVRTSGYSNFASTPTPSGNGSLIAVYTVFGNTNQLVVRQPEDAQMAGERCITGPIFEENFSAGNLSAWGNVAEAGTKIWTIAGSTDKYASFSPFANPKEASNIAWLISPEISLDAKDRNLNFRTFLDFPDTGHNAGELFVTTDYTGNPTTSTWTKLTAVFATAKTWTSSGAVSLSAFKGQKIRFAIKYTGSGTDTNRDGTLQVDNIKVE